MISVQAAGSTEKPIVIAESAFIIEYLIQHFGAGTTLIPTQWKEGQENKLGGETEEYLRYRYFMHYAEGSLMTLMLISIVAHSKVPQVHLDLIMLTEIAIKNSPVPFFIRPVTNGVADKITNGFLAPNFSTHFTFLEQQMATSPKGGKYLTGNTLTGADILMSFPLIAGKGRAGLTKEQYPKLYEYTELLESDANYKKAADKIVEIDGKFEATFKL